MTIGNTEIVQPTCDFHNQVGETIFEITEGVLNNATPFNTGNDMFNLNSESGNDSIQKDILSG
ncbi:MAG: hypothetical protein BroJett015_15150 [Chloroflexota bacterium]|nr:MAG: hypothetical protein BroJett015_15150 [Chloroflexota bacterium]